MNSKQKRELAMLIDGPPVPKTRGRKPFVPAPDFDDAMAALKPIEAEFVRHVLAGKTRAEAYGLTHPNAKSANGKRTEGHHLCTRPHVAHALALGQKSGAVAAIAGLAYDVKAADTQLIGLIDEAREAGQYSAVANMVRERLRLHKLTDNSPQAAAGASFTLIIRGQDGEERTLQPGTVIDVQPIEEGAK